jgi:SsrA-binding protein
MEILNKKARFDYFVEEEIEAGIALVGTEIKSIRKGSADLKESFILIKNNEALLLNAYIAHYLEGNQFNHDERRTRKLLLHKSEIKKLKEKKEREGITLVPLEIYFNGRVAKLKLGVCKGKKLYDKRQTIKERDLKRENRL